jgi:predicted transposase YdaD
MPPAGRALTIGAGPSHSGQRSTAIKTDREIYTLLGADAETLAILTDGIDVRGPYRFEALEVKGLDRRTDGVLLPDAPAETIWVIEFQARVDVAIYHRLLVEMGLVGERHPGRVVCGLILFATPALDPHTEPWHTAAKQPHAPLRVAYLENILEALEARAPEHPLLAVFLPYRVADRERLRREGTQALERLRTAPLPPRVRECLTAVFLSWLSVRFSDMSYREILTMFGIETPFEETRTYKELVALGREKGLEEGRQAEAATLLVRQAKRRFGPLPAALAAYIEQLPLATLEALADAILDVDSLDALDEWLRRA